MIAQPNLEKALSIISEMELHASRFLMVVNDAITVLQDKDAPQELMMKIVFDYQSAEVALIKAFEKTNDRIGDILKKGMPTSMK